MVLCYDSKTRLTTGFLGFVDSYLNRMLLPSILHSADDAMHPLTLPILCFNNSVTLLGKETLAHTLYKITIEKQITKATETPFLDAVPFLHIHQSLIESHYALTSSNVAFVQATSSHLGLELCNASRIISAERVGELHEKTENLKRCVEQMDIVISAFIHSRERLIQRVDVQMKVVRQSYFPYHCS